YQSYSAVDKLDVHGDPLTDHVRSALWRPVILLYRWPALHRGVLRRCDVLQWHDGVSSASGSEGLRDLRRHPGPDSRADDWASGDLAHASGRTPALSGWCRWLAVNRLLKDRSSEIR